MRNERSFAATLVTSYDQRLVLHLNLVLLLLRFGGLLIALFLFLLLLLLLLLLESTSRGVHLTLAHGDICLDKIVQVIEVGLVTIKLSNTKQVRISV